MWHAEQAPVLQGPLGVSTLAAKVPRSTVRNHGAGRRGHHFNHGLLGGVSKGAPGIPNSQHRLPKVSPYDQSGKWASEPCYI